MRSFLNALHSIYERIMGEIINLQAKLKKLPDNIISLRPWEFRKADWETAHFIQMLKSQTVKLEYHRNEVYKKGGKGIQYLPPHFLLKGGLAYSIRALYSYRESEQRMREVYYLIGLADCMINQVNPVLRTDLLRAMYKEVFKMKDELNIHWYGPLDQVLLPIDTRLYSDFEYRSSLKSALSMKELFQAIRKGMDKMFDILSSEYVFYCPGAGG